MKSAAGIWLARPGIQQHPTMDNTIADSLRQCGLGETKPDASATSD
jgi:hypothetical protein